MNTVKTIVLATLFSLGFLSMGATSGTPKNETNSVREKIQRAVSIPEQLKNPGFSQKVKVSFLLDASGCVQQVVANTTNLVLKQKLENQFKTVALPELKAGTYNVEINFNVY